MKLQVPINWNDMVHWGMANRQRDFPRPETLKLRNALKRVRLPYREVIAFINPHHMGGRMQWLDFVVWIPSKRRMGVILFETKWKSSNASTRTKQAFALKRQFLQEHGTPVLISPRYYATDEYELIVRRWVKTMDGREAGEGPT